MLDKGGVHVKSKQVFSQKEITKKHCFERLEISYGYWRGLHT